MGVWRRVRRKWERESRRMLTVNCGERERRGERSNARQRRKYYYINGAGAAGAGQNWSFACSAWKNSKRGDTQGHVPHFFFLPVPLSPLSIPAPTPLVPSLGQAHSHPSCARLHRLIQLLDLVVPALLPLLHTYPTYVCPYWHLIGI